MNYTAVTFGVPVATSILNARKISALTFETKAKNVTGGWMKDYNEEFRNLYSSSNIIRMIKSKMRCTRHVAYGRDQKLLQILVGKPEGKKLLAERRWEDDIKMDLKET
jgi:hypothetical protein